MKTLFCIFQAAVTKQFPYFSQISNTILNAIYQLHNCYWWDTSIFDKFVANKTSYSLPSPELMSKLINIFSPCNTHTLFSANPGQELIPRMSD